MKKFEFEAQGLAELKSCELVEVNGGEVPPSSLPLALLLIYTYRYSIINGFTDGWDFEKTN